MEVKTNISKNLKSIIKKIAKIDSSPEIKISDRSENGDYYTNIAMKLANDLRKRPQDIADEIKKEYDELSDINVKAVEVVKPGFINFFLSDTCLRNNLVEIISSQDEFGKTDKNHGKEVVVEYSSPNIAKPFTVGHLRSTIIGDAISNLMEATGWRVYRDNHLGDWGTQFGKQIYAIKTWGNEEELDKSQNPVKDLVALYVKFHEEAERDSKIEEDARAWFKKLEDHDPEARRLWQKCVEWSMREFDRLYEKLGIVFTENNGNGYGESFFEDKMKDVIEALNDKKLLTESDGARLVFFPDDKYPPLMIIKQDGATLYATRDLATDRFRLDQHGNDVLIVNEVGVEQSLYFNQLFELEKMLGWVTDGQREHVKHGHFRFKEGKMSTRKGNVIWLDDVLSEASKRAKALSADVENNADAIGIGALKWNDLKRSSQQDIVFDWEDMLNMHGNSGPYMQYAYVRTQSVISKADVNFSEGDIKVSDLSPEEDVLARLLVHFPEIIENAASSYSPNILATYLFELAQAFNLFYQKHQIISSDENVKPFRLALTAAAGYVIRNGLTILGIKTVGKM